jgi:hypothetical protein
MAGSSLWSILWLVSLLIASLSLIIDPSLSWFDSRPIFLVDLMACPSPAVLRIRICIQIVPWIMIRLQNADPDPDPATETQLQKSKFTMISEVFREKKKLF